MNECYSSMGLFDRRQNRARNVKILLDYVYGSFVQLRADRTLINQRKIIQQHQIRSIIYGSEENHLRVKLARTMGIRKTIWEYTDCLTISLQYLNNTP